MSAPPNPMVSCLDSAPAALLVGFATAKVHARATKDSAASYLTPDSTHWLIGHRTPSNSKRPAQATTKSSFRLSLHSVATAASVHAAAPTTTAELGEVAEKCSRSK